MTDLTWNYHCHTHYTDGKHTVEEIAAYCDAHGIEEIAITEHVRRELTYDFAQLRKDIARAGQRHKVRILTGVEAKILPDGTLDCPADLLASVDIVIGAIHNLNGMTREEASRKLAQTPCHVIGHPGALSAEIIALLQKGKKIVELNPRYPMDEPTLLACRDAGLRFSVGLDSHELSELDRFAPVHDVIRRLGLARQLWRFPRKT